jgi:Cu(I)/Ag(I) efflux system membrane fusion protein
MENNNSPVKWPVGRLLVYFLIALAAFILGGIVFHSKRNMEPVKESASISKNETIWTCSMDPQIRLHAPGKCPICGMDLIPLNQLSGQSDSLAVHFTKEAAALAKVMTSVVSRGSAVNEERLFGKVEPDERLIQSQVSHLSGRIEKLYVNVTGERVATGQRLAEIYSPELVTAQQELLETFKSRKDQPELYEASREKLRQWKLTDSQINDIGTSGSVITNFEILSNTSGIVTSKKVNVGDYVSRGMTLFEITDLGSVWVQFDAYESDLPFIKQGDKVTFTSEALPGSEFSGKVSFIDPVIDQMTRVARVRVEAANQTGKLKPGMFISGVVSSLPDKKVMEIVIPRSSVLWTGKRSIVYVRVPGSAEPVFRMREIILGPVNGNGYVVTGGLAEGEEIVTNGTFSVDAAAQLEGKPSMMDTSSSIN